MTQKSRGFRVAALFAFFSAFALAGVRIAAASPDNVVLPPESATAIGYQPTPVASPEEAERLFTHLKHLNPNSQSHQRQQVWAHDMLEESKINSMHVFLFVTPKFRETYTTTVDHWWMRTYTRPYPIWFHSAPLIYVAGEPMVLDPQNMPGPASLKAWSHHFLADALVTDVSNRRLTLEETDCPVISNYRDFKYNPSTPDWCMFRIVPMYYMQPSSVEMLDCDPTRDSWGKHSPNQRLSNGLIKYPCRQETRSGFNAEDLKQADHKTQF